ncbi:MAG TPA: 8-amino-7-oxononanoate synthase [Burkholderiales bacterium]|nr:8-amino-7-oxononanoate synthase [Burkholderiales bacterium]
MIFQRLAQQLAELERRGLRRSRLVRQSPQGPRIVVNGQEILAFCSNDYLGLANHPRIVEAAIEAASRYGVGEGASHLLSGHSAVHERLEAKLAEFMQMPRALLFSTGYQANIGAVTALAGPEDAIFSDALNHASLIDGVRLSRARVVRYPHVDLEFLSGALLAESSARTRLIVTDGVFSMDGDIAPLPAMLDLCERHDAWLLVDDAHAFGVIGPEGRGSPAYFALRSPRLVYVGTLGKAAGVAGAFVAGAAEVVETVLQRARTYIYTTAAPAMLAAAVETSLQLIREDEWRRERLRELIATLKRELRGSPGALASSDTPIQPLVLGGNSEAVRASAALRERGILVPAIRPPTVPEGTARLRISLSAAHSEQEVLRLAAALHEVCRSGIAAHA